MAASAGEEPGSHVCRLPSLALLVSPIASGDMAQTDPSRSTVRVVSELSSSRWSHRGKPVFKSWRDAATRAPISHRAVAPRCMSPDLELCSTTIVRFNSDTGRRLAAGGPWRRPTLRCRAWVGGGTSELLGPRASSRRPRASARGAAAQTLHRRRRFRIK